MLVTIYSLPNPMSAAGHTPVAGAVQEYSRGITLTYHFDDPSYPTWVKDAYTDLLQSEYPSLTYNNSDAPRFSAGSGGGTLFYRETNPYCGSQYWLGCAWNVGSTSFRVYLRKRSGGYPTWCDTNLVDGCYDARRVLIHEFEHVVLGVINHDGQGESNTVMAAGPPRRPNSGWDTRHFKRCDLAAAQLLYDVYTKSGAYANCFDDISNHGTYGLITDLTAGPANTVVCSGTTVTVSGRLQVHDYSSYGRLRANPLGARTVWIDREGVANYTSATTVAGNGNTWWKSFVLTTNVTITYDYVAHFDHPSGEGLDPSPDRAFSITWVRAVEC